jgi:hypothetical protein
VFKDDNNSVFYRIISLPFHQVMLLNYNEVYTCFYLVVFMYDRTKNDVAVVDQHGYETCTVTDLGDERYQTGYDEIKLKGGKTFFISSFPGNCESGTKIAINASPTISPTAI